MKNHTTKAGLLSALLLVSAGAFGVAGCTPDARQDVSNAGSDIGSATKKSADATKDVVASAGQSVEKGAVDAGKDIKKGADNAAAATDKAVTNAGTSIKNGANAAVQGTEKAASETGTAIKNGTNAAVQGTETAASKAGTALKEGTQTFTLTPKVKAAILADDSVKSTGLDIDTHSDSKQVVVNGTVSSDAMKKAAMADAKKAIAGDKSGYTLVDDLKVAK